MTDGPTAPAGFLSPAVRRAARETGVDVSAVAGTGAGGRVTVRDVERAVRPDPAVGSVATLEPVAEVPTVAAQDDRRVEFSAIRVRTAQNLRQSIDTAVHALVVTEVDYRAVECARDDAAAAGRSLTYLPFVARAVVDAIRQYPEVNAVVDGDALVIRNAINLGFAVDLDHAGLVVPVVRGADSMRLTTIADRVADLGRRGRDHALRPDDFVAGTFTITNVGRYGTLMAGPIINHPQVAILSTDGVKMRPVALPDGHGGYVIAVHPIGNLSLSFDHRAFDGAYASAFLATVRDTLESRDWRAEL
jgi:pyruvate dehydrogenase E2 component (dihydrolipoamide acetyltransferase)